VDGAFCQDPPRLTNTFDADPVLRETLARLIPAPASVLDVWRGLGQAAAGPLAALAREAEAAPPRHVPFDPWGRRVDAIDVSPAWTALQQEAARWGLAAAGYEPDLGPLARVHHFALLHLFGPSSAIWTCYLAMTDGAARTLIEHAPEIARHVVPHLTSRDPARLWTSGQWMTERGGGSDVAGGTRTVARPDGAGWRLHGTKWFTSAITSEIALTLARPEGASGLSLFYLEQRLPDGSRNGITIHRLKDKLGTRALPTAELSMDGTRATLVGEPGRGVKAITPLLNLTRLHNAISACGTMARLLQLLRDYARRRAVFGAPLADAPLHRETLAGLQVEYEAALALTLDCARLLGRREHGAASDAERAALRLLTPLAKLSTARQAVALASEALEGFGGAGYVEDTGLPVYLRDAQVLPIWEGTTNVLALDVRRAVARDGVLEPWIAYSRARLETLATGPIGRVASEALAHLASLGAPPSDGPPGEAGARRYALRLAALAAAVPLCEQAAWSLRHGHGERSALAAARWVRERIAPPDEPTFERLRESAVLSGLSDDRRDAAEPGPDRGERRGPVE
jgi:alkylation response protein AidB-like acyl-CoA dehydrogenase